MKFLMASPERGAIRAYVPRGSDTANRVSTVPLPWEGIMHIYWLHKDHSQLLLHFPALGALHFPGVI